MYNVDFFIFCFEDYKYFFLAKYQYFLAVEFKVNITVPKKISQFSNKKDVSRILSSLNK